MNEGHVRGWDDPRMPTLAGMRRRGYTPESIRTFVERAGAGGRVLVSVVDIQVLEHCLREELNKTAPRVMAVLRPLRVVIDNYPEGLVEEMDAINNPEDPAAGTRKVPFSKVLYIEQEDFREDPPKQFFRLAPGREVRLRSAYFVRCESVVKNEPGEVVELHCTYDPATRGGDAPDGRKVKSTIHWVSARARRRRRGPAVRLSVRRTPDPENTPEGQDFTANVNPSSLEVLDRLQGGARPGRGPARRQRFQFERQGYFCVDPDSAGGGLVFNRSVSLRDTWAKIEKAQKGRE